MAETIGWILRNKSGGIWSIAPEATVYDALTMMAERQVGALLVISGGTLVGIISERDYARKIILQGRLSKETAVQEIMTGAMHTVTVDDTVDGCMRVMTHHHIRHLPVFDGGKLVGVVSIGDLVNAIISEQARTIDHLHTYIGANYPA
ncbi:MAG TPA: CBS domain-containing protein [Candidatus Acidoferrales bacterium]|jgi:CBS domain-containing protein|nr:CBS domain-containing protein [Candidatus Acidoferrales bacterium]